MSTPGRYSDPSQTEPDERTRREERILDAAATLLVRFGYRKTTIDDVAREAGVGKGTIYLHWKDKGELFRAAIWQAGKQATDVALRRLAADPEGGKFHRMWVHGMLAIFENPLLAALMRGDSDLFQGLMETFPPEMIEKLQGNSEEHIAQLQQVGLIRSDLSVPTITFLMGAIKIGLIYMHDIADQGHTPPTEQLLEALSDLMRRWLEPEHLPSDSEAGRQIMTEWLGQVNDFAQQQG
jgi:AcrR family transcriptional regulator